MTEPTTVEFFHWVESHPLDVRLVCHPLGTSWVPTYKKAIGYLLADVRVVVIFDPKTRSASVYRTDDRQDIFEKDQTLVIPDVLPGFAVPVAKFFE